MQLAKAQSEVNNSADQTSQPLSIVVPNDDVAGFGRQAQAVRCLDQALSTIEDTADADVQVSALKLVDKELQHLLSITMSEYRGPGSHCGANATALRYILFLRATSID